VINPERILELTAKVIAMELTQVRLIVGDFTACFRFYRDVLGLKPQVDDENGPYGKLSPPEGTAVVALQQRDHLAQELPWWRSGTGDRALVVLKVDDMDEAVRGIRERGGEIADGPRTQWERLRVAYLRDPEDNMVELQQWLAPRT
jgi:catechol 2,3-dioxygenase-like lactoylglutathione lyase family enzyme